MQRTFANLFVLMLVAVLSGATALGQTPTGVDGVIGAEWTGVTPTNVPYTDGSAPDAQLVGFDVYVRCDANFLYIGLQALPATNPSGWCDAFALGLGSSANIYLDTDPANVNGSDLAFFPLGGFTFSHAYGAPDLSVEANMDSRPTQIFTAFNEGTPGDCPGGTQVGGVREFAIAWSLLETDPDFIGFPKLTASNNVVNVRTVQAFGYNFSGSQFPSRFGSCTDPNFPSIGCGKNKVLVCHKGKNTLCISTNAVQAHLNHGDALGACPPPKSPAEGEPMTQVPDEFILHRNYPNPFNPTTSISYALPTDAQVSLDVFDVLGRTVAQLVRGQVTAGYHDVVFDASALSSGMYFYRMTAAGDDGSHFTSVQKMILAK